MSPLRPIVRQKPDIMLSSNNILESHRYLSSVECQVTYASGYRQGVDLLIKAGVANARNEALWLLESVLGITRLDILAEPETNISPTLWAYAREVFKRRAKGEPLQYILGTQSFRGLEIIVRPGVLIPRPETQLIIEEVHAIFDSREELRIADIGTGSGCLVVALATEFPRAKLYATDCSITAIDIATDNANKNSVKNRICFLCGDLLEPLTGLPGVKGRLSAIVTNPPYIPTRHLDTLPRDVRDFEPHPALDGGRDGLSFYRRFLSEAQLFLQPGGYLFLEMGKGQVHRICEEAEDMKVWIVRNIRQDDANIDRIITLERKG